MRPTDYFDAAAAAHPERDCLVHGGRRWSYSAVRDISRRIATCLNQRGLTAGAHGAVLAPNDALGFTCTLGLMRAGLVWVPLNPRDAAPMSAVLLDTLDVDVLFVHSSLSAVVDLARTAAPRVREIVVFDTALEAWLGDTAADEVPVPDDPEALAALFATSGTTGTPRGVMHSNRSFAGFIDGLPQVLPHDVPPVYLATAPLTHVGGRACFPVLAQGGTIVVLEKPDPQTVLRALAEHAVTFTFLPPTALYSLLEQPNLADFSFPALRYLSYGSAPMRLDMLKRAIEVLGPVLSQGYGQTEAPMLITTLSPQEHLVGDSLAPDQRLSSVGRPTPVCDLAILDDDGTRLPTGHVGEICIRGGFVMEGYYKDPEGTAEVSKFGWHHTGDLGQVDQDGYVHLVDRKKDMIISGGFNVYAAEVERVISMDPAVADVVVIGVPDERWGEAVKAVVTTRPGATVDEKSLIARCKRDLGSVKAPKTVEVWEEVPRNGSGKILKREVRQRYWPSAGHAAQR
ncbi:class I adenylate-forming enzyme family protein [Streptomyces sp. DT195]|uniref:class I adenylate-forming enzyme family protein n=1 Tax=Streptomyces sp. DT195 TaxID=3393419 RepID=UPI003CEE5314